MTDKGIQLQAKLELSSKQYKTTAILRVTYKLKSDIL